MIFEKCFIQYYAYIMLHPQICCANIDILTNPHMSLSREDLS